MDVLHDEVYSDKELLELVFPGSQAWDVVARLEEHGVDVSFEIEDITDYHTFVRLVLEESNPFSATDGGSTDAPLEYEVEDNQHGRDVERGQPDFTVRCTGGDVAGLKENLFHVEFKFGDDSLRNSQFDWILDAVQDGYVVELMRLRKLG